MTQEEYMARRKEIREKIMETRIRERREIEAVEDDKLLAKRNAAEKIKAFTERVEEDKMEALRHLNRMEDEIHNRYAAERVELDCQVKLLDAEIKRQFYVSMKEGGEA